MDSRPELITELKKKYDGVYIDIDYPYDNPFKEIKSAIGNKGTFKNNIIITESKG